MRRFIVLILSLLTAAFVMHTEVEAVGTNYYIDSTYGNDAYNGRFPSYQGGLDGPWRSVFKVNNMNSASCVTTCSQPGDVFSFAGGSYLTSATLTLARSGNSTDPITFNKYNGGSDPLFHTKNPCINVLGSWLVLEDLNTHDCHPTSGPGVGVNIQGDFNILRGGVAQNNMRGIDIDAGADSNQVTEYIVHQNSKGDGTGSSGVGINIHGSNNEIDHSILRYNYWVDVNGCRKGDAIEIYGEENQEANSNQIHHNLAYDNKTFSELGIKTSGSPNYTPLGQADGNAYYSNVIYGSLAPTDCGSSTSCANGWKGISGLVTRGPNETPDSAGEVYGPVYFTSFINNTINFTGECSQGIVCGGDCHGGSTYVLLLMNTISKAVWKGVFIGNKTGISFPSNEIDYSIFRESGSGQGNQDCQFQLVSPCPALTNGLAHHTDPQLVSASDLHLQCTSPALETGTLLGVSEDYDGTSIPQGDPDIGAYEMIC